MINDALRTLLPYAGWSEDRTDSVEFTGGTDPVLPTSFRMAEASSAVLAAVGLAAADLWKLRTGREQSVAVDARQATASLRSSRYLQVNGKPGPVDRNPMVGSYPTKDNRWVYLHCNFPHHRAIASRILGGVPEDKAAVRKAVAQWNGLDLEEALVAAGGVGGMVRTFEEWAQHPQGQAVASLPLLEITRIGDSPPEPLPAGDRPLSGIRAVDVTRVVAGPTCGRTLAEFGADVMKISAAHLPFLDRQELDTGHGKLSAYVDLRDEPGRETLRNLIRDADIFTQGYRPGTIGGRGFSPEALAKLRPGIIAVSLSAFGHVGPWASRRGFDTIVQTVSGITARQGELFPGDEPGPRVYPTSAVDFLTGYLMAFGAMVALRRRAREGGSWFVRTSLAQVGHWLIQRGQVPPQDLKDVPEDVTAEEIERWSTVTETPVGTVKHFTPVVRLSETPTRWVRPMVPLGYHEPVWPPRR